MKEQTLYNVSMDELEKIYQLLSIFHRLPPQKQDNVLALITGYAAGIKTPV